ncbi:uncharacterized protein, partial [Heterodontus francisci]|uniref:uncharacterized protein n=1 Tax=Heterodontus francisci TaxID=7792 RepID=UPI00355BDBBB
VPSLFLFKSSQEIKWVGCFCITHFQLDNKVFGVTVREGKKKGELKCCFQVTIDKIGKPSNKLKGTSHNDPNIVKIIEVKDLRKTIEIETGYGDTNAWVEWIKLPVKSLNKNNCYACASGRPIAQVVPFPLGWERDRKGMECMLALYQDKTAWGIQTCISLSIMFPPLEKEDSRTPPSFLATSVNHTSCVRRHGAELTSNMGELKSCIETEDVTGRVRGGNYSSLNVPRADLWWYCGGKILRQTLPSQWKGTCAIVQLAIPFTLAFEKQKIITRERGKREAIANSFDDQVYMDFIGVPRGVPDEFKARNQITAGFESLFWWVTINKNVDWINYIYYNQQRFINYTRDAVKGIAEQLDATSRMAWENRLALDMILAEKGGVCIMFGGKCCTFIPNNTAPDGSITRALQGLTTLAEEMAENSGADTSLTGWLESWFGKWKGMIISVFTSLIMVVRILIAIGCCIIPCVRGLTQRLIETALTKQMSIQRGQEESIYLLGNDKVDSINGDTDIEKAAEIMLRGFERTYENPPQYVENNKD